MVIRHLLLRAAFAQTYGRPNFVKIVPRTTVSQADFTSFLRETANLGFSFRRERYSVIARWNYRGRNARVEVPSLGPDGMEWEPVRTMLELCLGWQIGRHLSVTAVLFNALNETFITERYGPRTPGYARRTNWQFTGQSLSLRLKGSF